MLGFHLELGSDSHATVLSGIGDYSSVLRVVLWRRPDVVGVEQVDEESRVVVPVLREADQEAVTAELRVNVMTVVRDERGTLAAQVERAVGACE